MGSAREKWLSAADDIFRKYGYQKTSMEEIAQRAQKAKGSLYYHFGSKEQLFAEVVGEELDRLKAGLEVIFQQEGLDSRERIRQYMLRRMQILRESPNYIQTLRPEFFEHHHFFDAHKQALTNWEIDKVLSVIRQGIQQGEISLHGDLSVYARVLVMMLRGLEPGFFLQGEFDRLVPHLDNLIGIITRGISPQCVDTHTKHL